MEQKIDITAGIVLYNDDVAILRKTIDSFLSIPLSKTLFLFDNSRDDSLGKEFVNEEIVYIHSKDNLGFGRAHNKALQRINNSAYHLVLNPDVTFKSEVITALIEKLNSDPNLTMIAPKVVFPDGKHQYSCRKYPSFFEMLVRRSIVFRKPFHSVITKGEYRDRDLTKPFHPDFIQGCFQLYKTEDFIKIGGFDERYFLYMEDVDICRKIDGLGKKKLYYPEVQITHVLKKGSSKNLRLFFIHLSSSIKYFKKWGFR